MTDTHYAFLDESSSLGNNDPFFVLGVVLADPIQQTQIERILKKIRRRYLKKKKELKFYEATPRVKEKVLKEIAGHNIKIIVFAVEKEKQRIKDTPGNYGLVVRTLVTEYLSIYHGNLNLTVDKRYTPVGERSSFDQVVQDHDQTNLQGCLAQITHAESHNMPLLQLADFIAGAANQKYNRGDSSYLDLVADKIIIEGKITWRELRRFSK